MALSHAERQRRYRRAHPDRIRAYDRTEARRVSWRDHWRRKHDVPRVPLGSDPQLDAAPFVRWLGRWIAQWEIESYSDAARQLHVSAEMLARLADGRRTTVALSAVSRALDHTYTGVWELYDDDLRPIEPLA